MKLEQLSSDSFIHLERWVNQPKYSATAQYSEVGAAYHPRFGEPTFRLPVFKLPRAAVEIIEADPTPVLRDRLVGGEGVAFFCHPDGVDEFAGVPGFAAPAEHLTVSPTSSTRTVLTREEADPFMIKLHLNRRISRFIRRLTRDSISHSVLISQECERLARRPDCPREFAFLPESLGVCHREKGVGYLLRELRPRPFVEGPRFLVPFFALYSADTKNPADAPLLTQILARHGGAVPFEYFLRTVMGPFLKVWAFAFLRGGLMFEAHGQNTLLEIDEAGRPTRIVERDFQSLPVDPLVRRRLGLPQPFRKHVIGEGDYPRLLEHSLLYDHFIGDYLFKSLAEYFAATYGVGHEEFAVGVRRTFRRFVPEAREREFFPQGHVTFGELGPDNSCPLVYYHDAPAFRPGY